MGTIKDIIDYIAKLFTWWVVVMPWEQGIRVTLGKEAKVIQGGIFLKVPLLHTVYVQEKRLRIIQPAIQTLTSIDGKVITVRCSLGYSIVDIKLLYNTISQPDSTIQNLVLGKISEYICGHNLEECSITSIESYVVDTLNSVNYGLKFENVKITDYAIVKTFRLIQDQSSFWEGLDLKIKR